MKQKRRAGAFLPLHQVVPTDITLNMQWHHLAPTLAAIFAEEPPQTPGKRREPHHALTLRPGLTLKRERDRLGWVIRFYGEEAKSPGLIDDVFDLVDMWMGERR